jgi:hypothetical protein
MTETDAPIQVSSYTPTELSYLLAGRDNVEARRARSVLGLSEMHEGDPELLLAVQSLASRGLVRVEENIVEIANPAKVLGFVLGTGTDWTRLIVQADGRVDAVVVIASPDVPGALALRATSLGNYEAVATQPGVHPSQITGAMVTGYLDNFDQVLVSVHRDTTELSGVLIMEHTRGSEDWSITLRTSVPGAEDVADGTTEIVDEKTFYSNLEHLLA